MEEEDRQEMEKLEQQMIDKRLTQQRLDSMADRIWLEQEEMNIELPRSPVVRPSSVI
jgi:ribonucleotide reductase alpha subunit